MELDNQIQIDEEFYILLCLMTFFCREGKPGDKGAKGKRVTVGSEIVSEVSIFYSRKNWDKLFTFMLNRNEYMKQILEDVKKSEDKKPLLQQIFQKTKKVFKGSSKAKGKSSQDKYTNYSSVAIYNLKMGILEEINDILLKCQMDIENAIGIIIYISEAYALTSPPRSSPLLIRPWLKSRFQFTHAVLGGHLPCWLGGGGGGRALHHLSERFS